MVSDEHHFAAEHLLMVLRHFEVKHLGHLAISVTDAPSEICGPMLKVLARGEPPSPQNVEPQKSDQKTYQDY
jgi:hypothetical protein